jgi:chemotaxis protein CheX
MQFFENEIKEYAEFAWSTLDLQISPSSGQFDGNSKNSITANIQISGQWQGVVALTIDYGLAEELAVNMFSIDKGQVTDSEINDALSEMINIIGGNLKSLLPQPNQLSLPMVGSKGTSLHFPFTEQCSQVVFDCGGKKFMVTIHQVTDKNLHNQLSEAETSPAS